MPESKHKLLIKIKGLEKTYFNGEVATPVLHGINLEVRVGEFLAIMGPSGSGKSTLMHILGFLDQLSGGEYLYEGIDVAKLKEDDLALIRLTKVGFVFQAFFLLPHATVLENVMLPLTYSKGGDDRHKALEALEAVGLSHRINYLPMKLSGGEKQRVAIARALINNPDIIFADEPTGNLDSISGKQVMNLLDKLNKKGHTIILVTHETTMASYAQREIYLTDGLIKYQKIIKKTNHFGALK